MLSMVVMVYVEINAVSFYGSMFGWSFGRWTVLKVFHPVYRAAYDIQYLITIRSISYIDISAQVRMMRADERCSAAYRHIVPV